jgi:hypothetical protein
LSQLSICYKPQESIVKIYSSALVNAWSKQIGHARSPKRLWRETNFHNRVKSLAK